MEGDLGMQTGCINIKVRKLQNLWWLVKPYIIWGKKGGKDNKGAVFWNSF